MSRSDSTTTSDDVQPIFRALSLTSSSSRYDGLVHDLNLGELDLDAPYQRGHVWNQQRQVNLIRSLTMGLPTAAVYLNRRDVLEPTVVIDGKQRITAVARWLSGDLQVPAEWFPVTSRGEQLIEPSAVGAPLLRFVDLTASGQRLWRNAAHVAVYWAEFTGPDAIEREQELFGLINFGGVPQGESDFD